MAVKPPTDIAIVAAVTPKVREWTTESQRSASANNSWYQRKEKPCQIKEYCALLNEYKIKIIMGM
jgi:hypothetical protein